MTAEWHSMDHSKSTLSPYHQMLENYGTKMAQYVWKGRDEESPRSVQQEVNSSGWTCPGTKKPQRVDGRVIQGEEPFTVEICLA